MLDPPLDLRGQSIRQSLHESGQRESRTGLTRRPRPPLRRCRVDSSTAVKAAISRQSGPRAGSRGGVTGGVGD